MSRFIARHKVLWMTSVAVIVAFFVLWMAKAPLLSMALSLKTGVKISVSDWSIGWRSMSFRNLRIRTPLDPVYPTALSIGSIEIKAGLFDLMRKTSHIESIAIDNVFMGINMHADGSSNWSQPLQKLSSGSSSRSSGKSDIHFVIDNFDLNNVTVALTTPGKGEKKYGPSSIHAKNLGSDRPMGIGGLVQFIAREITAEIIKKYALPNLFKGIIKAPGRILFSPLKKLFSQADQDVADHSIDGKEPDSLR